MVKVLQGSKPNNRTKRENRLIKRVAIESRFVGNLLRNSIVHPGKPFDISVKTGKLLKGEDLYHNKQEKNNK